VEPLARFGRILTELDTTQLELVAFRKRYSGAIEKGLRSVFEASIAVRRCEADKPALKCLGGLTFTSLRKIVPEFVVDRRGLLLIRSGSGDGLPDVRVRSATATSLLELAPWVLRFPDWPFQATPAQAVMLTESLKKKRLLLRYGALRLPRGSAAKSSLP
jgi:hypothetical protein